MDALCQHATGASAGPKRQSSDPAKLPPAGRLTNRDGDHVDARELLYRKTPHRLRSTATWIAPSTKSPDRPVKADISAALQESAAAFTRPPRVAPKRDVDKSWPAPAAATTCTATARNTDPLQPKYSLPAGEQSIYPVAPVASNTVQGHIFERSGHPEWSFDRGSVPLGTQNADIEGSCPKPARQRERVPQKVAALDYSDVSRSMATQCLRHVALERDGRPPVDVTPLGKWMEIPDEFMHRSGRHGNPVEPEYFMHGRHIVDGASTGKGKRQVPENVDYSRRIKDVVADPQQQTLANKMVAMAVSTKPRNFWPHKQGILDLHYPRTSKLGLEPSSTMDQRAT